MTATELLERIEHPADVSVDEIADDLYLAVKDAIAHGQSRDELYAQLQEIHGDLAARGAIRQRRAVAEVLACFEGYCAPSLAL